MRAARRVRLWRINVRNTDFHALHPECIAIHHAILAPARVANPKDVFFYRLSIRIFSYPDGGSPSADGQPHDHKRRRSDKA